MIRSRNCRSLVDSVRPTLCRNAAALIALAGSFISLTSLAASGDGWVRCLVPIGHGPAPGVPFTIADIGSANGMISARGWYSFTQGKDSVVLHGKREDDIFFRPLVGYEVATEGKTKWRKLRTEDGAAGPDSVTLSPENPRIAVTIDLDPLRAHIGIYRYARVVLENGDFAVVALEDLLPRARARDTAGNFKEDIIGGGSMLQYEYKLPRPDDPAVLSNVISLGGQLIGEFIFDSRSQSVSLTGTRTLDGDFWPAATLLVGNSLEVWQEIGKSTNNGAPTTLQITSGKAETLRILLTDYKAQISKYKYGKIVFSNGQSMVFYLNLLDPDVLARTQ